MKTLLKAADAKAQSGVQRLADRTRIARSISEANPPPDDMPPVSPEVLRIAELERFNATLEAQLREAEEAAAARETASFEQGLTEGAARAASRDEERIQALADALAAAQAELSERLARLDILALELAQTALARIFGDEALYPGMVAATLRHRMAELKETIAIRASVSRADFSDDAAFALLAAEHPALELLRDSALGPGDCRIDLRLGRVDAGICGQWERLSSLIDEIAQQGVDA